MTNELIQSNINFLKEYIPKLILGIESQVDALIKNDEIEAFKLLTSIIEGLEWTIRSISGLVNLGVVSGIQLEEMNNFLIEIEQAFKRKDFVMLSDLLQYEIAVILDNWKEKLENIDGDIS